MLFVRQHAGWNTHRGRPLVLRSLLAATTLKFEGTSSMTLNFDEGVTNEADLIRFRFRTAEPSGLLMMTSHDRSQDALDISLEDGRIKVGRCLALPYDFQGDPNFFLINLYAKSYEFESF